MSARNVWRLVDSGAVAPPESAAMDEALLSAHSSGLVPNTLHFYARSSPTVSVGRFQSVRGTVDLDACLRLGVSVVRRGSGGGSIYTDQGQLIYALVVRSEDLPRTPEASFAVVCGALARAVSSLGLEARHRPVNDVEVGGRKVSGSAQLRRRGSLLQHGTVMVASDLSVMDSVLRAKDGLRPSERVANIADLLGRTPAMDEVKAALSEEFSDAFGAEFLESGLTRSEEESVDGLARERYSRDDWNLRM